MPDLFKRQTWPWRSGLWFHKASRDFCRDERIRLKRRARARLKRMLLKLLRIPQEQLEEDGR